MNVSEPIRLSTEQKLSILRNYRRLIAAVFPDAHRHKLDQITWDYATSRKIELEEIWSMGDSDDADNQ